MVECYPAYLLFLPTRYSTVYGRGKYCDDEKEEFALQHALNLMDG